MAIARFVAPSAWSADDRAQVARGLGVWRGLGFTTAVEVEPTLPLCPNDWYKRTPQLLACSIVIALRKEPGMIATYSHYAQSDRATDVTTVDDSVHGKKLASVIAHEAGHVLLNTSSHTTYGAMAPGGDFVFLAAHDKRLACLTIGRGCK
jgi:hypothetical protein